MSIIIVYLVIHIVVGIVMCIIDTARRYGKLTVADIGACIVFGTVLGPFAIFLLIPESFYYKLDKIIEVEVWNRKL